MALPKRERAFIYASIELAIAAEDRAARGGDLA